MKPVSALFALATSVILSLSVAGCAAVESEPKPAATDPSIPAELTKFYQQQVKWSGCEGYLKCGEVEVPLDWQNPTGDTIQLAVIYRPADSNDPIGSLLVNPGGPGSSAHSWLALDPEGIATDEIRESFNIVAFDPRGVGRSAAVRCSSFSRRPGVMSGYLGSYSATRASISSFCSEESDLMPTQTSRFCH